MLLCSAPAGELVSTPEPFSLKGNAIVSDCRDCWTERCINESINEALSACMRAEQNRVEHASADTTSADTGRFVFRFRLEKPLLALPLVYLHF